MFDFNDIPGIIKPPNINNNVEISSETIFDGVNVGKNKIKIIEYNYKKLSDDFMKLNYMDLSLYNLCNDIFEHIEKERYKSSKQPTDIHLYLESKLSEFYNKQVSIQWSNIGQTCSENDNIITFILNKQHYEHIDLLLSFGYGSGSFIYQKIAHYMHLFNKTGSSIIVDEIINFQQFVILNKVFTAFKLFLIFSVVGCQLTNKQPIPWKTFFTNQIVVYYSNFIKNNNYKLSNDKIVITKILLSSEPYYFLFFNDQRFIDDNLSTCNALK